MSEENRQAGWRCHGQCVAKWQYLKATLRFDVEAVNDLDDEELDHLFVHECCHALVNEMREWDGEHGIDHEERVVTMLTNAFGWMWQAGRDAGRAEKKRNRK